MFHLFLLMMTQVELIWVNMVSEDSYRWPKSVWDRAVVVVRILEWVLSVNVVGLCGSFWVGHSLLVLPKERGALGDLW